MIQRILPIRNNILFLLLTTAVTLLMGGCTFLGPEYHRPEPVAPLPAAYQNAPETESGTAPAERWWKDFNNPEIDRLVEQVLRGNPDIERATAVILEMNARRIQTRADRFPTLGLESRARKSQSVQTQTLPGISADRRVTDYTLSFPASFELDLWGKLSRADKAAQLDILQAEESRAVLIQTLISEAVSLYLQIEALERRIQITEQSIRAFKRSARLVERRYERGLSPVLDLRQARRVLAQAEAGLPDLKQELGTAQQRLKVLAGRYPLTRPPKSQPGDYYRPPATVPSGLPSELLARRPDIRAAEAKLMALNARVAVAKAGRFPRISLTGSLGYSSPELRNILDPASEIWSLAMGIAQPLFDAGRLRAGQQAAEAGYQQGVAEYAKTILTAFAEVEGALLTRRQQMLKRKRVIRFLEEARATQRLAESRYNRGLVDYLTVLDAQQTRFAAEKDLVLVDLAILTNRVSLHRALGGGWGSSAETADSVRNTLPGNSPVAFAP